MKCTLLRKSERAKRQIVFDKIRDKDEDNAFQGMRTGWWDFLLRETRSARISM